MVGFRKKSKGNDAGDKTQSPEEEEGEEATESGGKEGLEEHDQVNNDLDLDRIERCASPSSHCFVDVEKGRSQLKLNLLQDYDINSSATQISRSSSGTSSSFPMSSSSKGNVVSATYHSKVNISFNLVRFPAKSTNYLRLNFD